MDLSAIMGMAGGGGGMPGLPGMGALGGQSPWASMGVAMPGLIGMGGKMKTPMGAPDQDISEDKNPLLKMLRGGASQGPTPGMPPNPLQFPRMG